ncbi:hypothetical protein Desgi_2785 [Desulfoscipio gibsoniae DSM 7213]|uniref:Methyl-accepting chemotaxis protein n=2 Tax=Desulfoscipio gibsoniae TaxID=102134 RepID=R4KRE8_9FIRM|nr:hypothetical protein Desgi_2785 [Desulfoscipio gibsoniae DSM 7213]
MTEKLEHFAGFLPYVQQMMGVECTFGISDREKYIAYLPGKELVLPLKVGDPIKAGSMADKVITGGLQASNLVGKEVFGIPYMGIGIPIKDDNGKVIGSLVGGMPVTVEEDVNLLIARMTDDLKAFQSLIINIVATIQEYAETVNNLCNSAELLKSKMNAVNPIFEVIKDVHLESRVLVLMLLRKKIEDMLPSQKYR